MNWTWVLTIASIVGVVLNIKKHRLCFLIWAITNFMWAIVDYQAGLYAQSALFLLDF